MRRDFGSSTSALPAALLVSLALALPADRVQGAPPGPPEAAFVDAHSAAEVARTARGLRLGARLHLEGVALGPGGTPVGLDLERFRVFAEEGRVVVHGPDGEEERPFPAHTYFRGGVIGEPGSSAVLTVPAVRRGAAGVRGIVRVGSEIWELREGAPRADGSRPLAGRQVEVPAPEDGSPAGFACAAEALAPPPGGFAATTAAPVENTAEAAATGTAHTARVAVETDHELYQQLGGETALTDYVGDLFAYASSIYDAEIATDLQVTHLSVWATSADPYQYTQSCGLYEFGRYWNDNRAHVGRTIAHFVSGKSSSSGVAWLGVLCQGPFTVNHGGACAGLSPQIDDYGGAYGFSSGIRGSFDPASPSPVWDIVAVSHEIGHNFNSPHTHCYDGLGGSSSPVDECYNAEPGCYGGTPRLPGAAGTGSGTLMSYCHLLSPGLSNLSLTFGTGHPYGVLPQRVPDRMRAHVEARAGAAPSCLERIDGGGGPCDDLTLSNQTVRTTKTFEACGTLRAGDGFAVVDPGNVTLLGGTVVLESGFSVGSGARLRVETP